MKKLLHQIINVLKGSPYQLPHSDNDNTEASTLSKCLDQLWRSEYD